MRVTSTRWWLFIARWARVALATALLLAILGWIRSDQKIATLERQRQASTHRGDMVRERLSAVEHGQADLRDRVARLEAAAGFTTTTATTVYRKPTVSPPRTSVPTRTPPTPPTTTRSAPTTTTRPCRVFIPVTHQCVLVSVTLGRR